MLHSSFRKDIREELIRRCIIKAKCKLSSGKESNYLINCKPLMLSSTGQYLLGQALGYELPRRSAAAVAGYGLGGYALAAAVSSGSKTKSWSVDALFIRKQAKKHGTKSLIEGTENIQIGDEVIVVEDVVTTGKSVIKAVNILKDAGYKSDLALSIVDREEGGKEKLFKQGINLVSLFKAEELLQ